MGAHVEEVELLEKTIKELEAKLNGQQQAWREKTGRRSRTKPSKPVSKNVIPENKVENTGLSMPEEKNRIAALEETIRKIQNQTITDQKHLESMGKKVKVLETEKQNLQKKLNKSEEKLEEKEKENYKVPKPAKRTIPAEEKPTTKKNKSSFTSNKKHKKPK